MNKSKVGTKPQPQTFSQRFPNDGATVVRVTCYTEPEDSIRRIDIYNLSQIGITYGRVSVVLLNDPMRVELSYEIFKSPAAMDEFYAHHWPKEEAKIFQQPIFFDSHADDPYPAGLVNLMITLAIELIDQEFSQDKTEGYRFLTNEQRALLNEAGMALRKCPAV